MNLCGIAASKASADMNGCEGDKRKKHKGDDKMYDHYINTGDFGKFKAMINKVIYGEANYDLQFVEKLANKSFEEGRLSSSQYDYLMRLIDKFKF